MLERNKKKLILGLAAVLVVVIVVVAGVAIGTANDNNDFNDSRAIVKLDMKPEGYSENPADSTIVAVFASRIDDRLVEDPNYTYNNAISDYEIAYNGTSDNIKVGVAYEYANFVFRETKDLDKAKEILKRIEETVLKNNGAMRYYTTLSMMCMAAGMEEEANNYKRIMEEVAPPEVVVDDAVVNEEEQQ